MSGEARDPAAELESQMEAAGELIENLEGEVADLRRDLEEARQALRAAQGEVAARERTLQESGHAREAAQSEASNLRDTLSNLRAQSADEQLALRNQHIKDLAALREELEEQRRADVEAAGSGERFAALRDEFRREREATEERHRAEIEALKVYFEQWEEKYREGYRENDERYKAEDETLR